MTDTARSHQPLNKLDHTPKASPSPKKISSKGCFSTLSCSKKEPTKKHILQMKNNNQKRNPKNKNGPLGRGRSNHMGNP